MRFLISEKLGPHKYKTTEGYLVCVDAILSRTGIQEYRRCELFGDACDDPDKIITVDRKTDEVFSDKTMASFENKAICIEHPNANVNVENHNELSVGFVRDIRRGEDNGTPVMMGTLVITDKEAVEAVESGEYKDLSCGYDCDIKDEHSPQQRNIRGNHVALCKQGRAGIARIVDSTNYINDEYTDFEYGYRDGKAGTYDKWYRYNRKDEGKEYDMGIQKAKGESYEIKNFIKGTGDSMKDELLTDMDVDELMKYYTGKNTKHGANIFKINGKYSINPNISSRRYNTIAELEVGEEKYSTEIAKGYAKNDPNQFGDSAQTQDTFTVEYVKDDITHIVEVEATSLGDAILKAKEFIIKDKINDATAKVKDGRIIYLSSGEKLNTDTAIVEYKQKKCEVHEASSDGTNINISSIGPGILYKWVNIKEVKILKH